MSSLWYDGSELPVFSSLNENKKTDVLIVGGGMAGILTAYFLKERNIPYILVEKDSICSGVTGYTTAKLTLSHGLIYSKIIKKYGVDAAAAYLRGCSEALDKYATLCRGIDCDYEVRDNYVYSLDDRQKLENEVSTLERLGFDADLCEKLPLPIDTVGAVRCRDQAQFHPLKFISEIAKDLNIYEYTQVIDVDGSRAFTDKYHVDAKIIVMAAHFPFIDRYGGFFLKMYQHRSYVTALEGAGKLDGMYVDESGDGLSFRSYENLLLLGGGGHRTGKRGGGYACLRDFARNNYPDAREKFAWATQDCITLDGIPYVGRYSASAPHLYVATGFNKWGMVGSMMAATLLCDMICGEKNELCEVLNPSRSILHGQLFVNAFETLTNILRPTAPRCSHLGCALKWNSAEKSWDCACHGSRFDENGRVINNPANKDLKRR
ncbi:MAG: FAD-dependent oxidoreductase [Clostridia bacterium]|nr:FAD-dependent oxidoreductase [Clostridia bacterium]